MKDTARRLVFKPRSQFSADLQEHLNSYLYASRCYKEGGTILYAKAAFSYLLFFIGYVGLVFTAKSAPVAIFFAFVLTQGMVLVGFNVMHDGAHGSFSRKNWLNWLAGASMDILGGSQSLWRQKHNMLHHTYTNVNGKDDDINLGLLMRLAPQQPWRAWHRVQHLYAPVLYSLFSLYSVGFGDFHKLLTNRISDVQLQARRWWELPYFFLMKSIYVGYSIIIPMQLHSARVTIIFFICIHLLFGFTLSLIFQLAHAVMGVEFPCTDAQSRMPYDWATHQLCSTSNFAVDNTFVRLYTGGLNHQVEHHLFHRVSHVHYHRLSKIVRQTCLEYGLTYHVNPTFFSAIRSHFAFLYQMGRDPGFGRDNPDGTGGPSV